ncbi:MAG: desulfoferrodoxin [Candidatus Saganbacteria bacterium]|nr:desulfoferrodoxin [Candidatus Saganbacteria bacterium]
MAVANRLEVYKCSVCGNIVEVLFVGGGELVCCGQPMVLQVENTVDASKEKHVPVIEKMSEGIKVKIGSIAHPMEDKHYIQWVQIIAGDRSYREFLRPGMTPEAVFKLANGTMSAREYCNLHGLWKS